MHDNWVASFRTQQPESLPILRKSTKVLGRIRRVRFTKATEHHANIRENKDPSLGKIQAKNLHERSRYALKFEGTSQEEIERQERCVRGDAWSLTNNVLKFKAKDEVFFSPTNAIRKKKPEERKIVVDSGASMHMLHRKDLNSAKLEIVRVSKVLRRLLQPTAKCKQKKKRPCTSKNWICSLQEGFSMIHWLFSENSAGFLRADQWSETTTYQRWQTEKCNTENCVQIVVSGSSSSPVLQQSSSCIASSIKKK